MERLFRPPGAEGDPVRIQETARLFRLRVQGVQCRAPQPAERIVVRAPMVEGHSASRLTERRGFPGRLPRRAGHLVHRLVAAGYSIPVEPAGVLLPEAAEVTLEEGRGGNLSTLLFAYTLRHMRMPLGGVWAKWATIFVTIPSPKKIKIKLRVNFPSTSQ
jgi:hypothetical protein